MKKQYKGIIAIIKNNKGEVLMGKKVNKPGHFLSNSWHLPGGKLNENEEAEVGLIREMYEELGIEIKVIEYLCDYPVEVNDQIFLSKCLICELEDSNAKVVPGDDLQEARFFPINEIKDLHNKDIMQKWPKELKEYFGI